MIRRFARPYARAIMDVVKTPQAADALRAELARFEKARAAAKDLQEFYSNPGFEIEAKLKVTRAVAAKLEMSEMAVKVLDILIRNHRVNDLGAIVDAVAAYVRESTNTLSAEVRSAHELNENEVAELRRTLETKFGRKVDVDVKTDPKLLGGFVAKVGSEIYDASVVGKIEKFRESLS